jgi:hypothetical protein
MSRPLSNVGLAFALLPDLLSVSFFLLVWADPLALGPASVKTAMLTMLLEFYLVHAAGFFPVITHSADFGKWRRIGAIAGLSSFYLLMIAAYAKSFGQWWPLLAFAWLAAGKVAWIWMNPRGDEGAIGRQMAAWAASVALFLFGVVLTSIQDVPRWGMTADVQPRFGLDMASEGLWESQPHRVVAFGVLYFGVTLLAKALFALWMRRKAARSPQVM